MVPAKESDIAHGIQKFDMHGYAVEGRYFDSDGRPILTGNTGARANSLAI